MLPVEAAGEAAFVTIRPGQEIIHVEAISERLADRVRMACQTRFGDRPILPVNEAALVCQHLAPPDEAV